MTFDCSWLDRTSALIDGELPRDEQELVRTHAKSCQVCGQFIELNKMGIVTDPSQTNIGRQIGVNLHRSVAGRVVLAIAGVVLTCFAIAGFLKGNGDAAGLHDIRHLSIWQVSLGMSVIALSLSFRLSLFLTSMTASFLALTGVATLFDLLHGHRGPWTDITHLVEVFALIILLVLTRPNLRLLRTVRSEPDQQTRPASDSR